MARLFSIILLILIASPAWAFPPLIAGKSAGGAAAFACAANDVQCDDFDSSSACGDGSHTNCRQSYTVGNSANGVVDFNAAAAPALGGVSASYVVDITDNSSSAGPYIEYDSGSNRTELYCQGYSNIIDNTDSNGRRVYIFIGSKSASQSYPKIQLNALRTAEGTYSLELSHQKSGGGAIATVATTAASVSTGAWVGWRIYWKANQVADGITWYSDVTLDGTFDAETTPSDTSTQNEVIRYFSTGPGNTNADLTQFQVDMVECSTTGFPAARVP